jgi:hypothetical protein
MASTVDLLDAALRRMAEQMCHSRGEHPSTEQLLSYLDGKTAAEENEHIQDHLSLCPECCQLLLEAQSFRMPAPTEDEVAAAAAEWPGFLERLSRLSEQPAGFEGTSPLAQHFLRAGTARVVANCWSINDQATTDFMTQFYSHLLKQGLLTSGLAA